MMTKVLAFMGTFRLPD